MVRLDLEDRHYLDLARISDDRNIPETIRRCIREAAFRSGGNEIWVMLQISKPPLFPVSSMRPLILPAYVADQRVRRYQAQGFQVEITAVDPPENDESIPVSSMNSMLRAVTAASDIQGILHTLMKSVEQPEGNLQEKAK